MLETSSEDRRLSANQLGDLLALLADADSVELKLTVPATDHRSVVRSLDMDPLDGQIRQVFFFDTPDLALNASGVVVRGRRVQGRGDDSVVKLRPVVPNKLPPDLRKSSNFVVEVDAMPGGYVCSASMKGAPKSSAVMAVAKGTKPIHKLFSKEQRRFYAANAPDGLALEDLTILGPLTVLKLKFKPKEFKSKLIAELWFYPDGSRILELSVKCLPKDGVQTAVESRLFLSKNGVDLSGEQQTKTKTALDYFAGELAKTDVA